MALRVGHYEPVAGPAARPPEVARAGALPLVILPGHTARLEGFARLAPLLAIDRSVVVIELPACGESDRPVRRYDLAFYEETIVAVLDSLGLDRVVPVGGSLGGNLVLRLAHRWPERFPALVVWAPGSAWRARPWLAALTRRIASRATFWPSVWIQSRFWYAKDHPGRAAALADTFAYYRRAMSAGFVRMYWGLAADQVAHSLFDLAPAITQPTLLMWGDQDHGAGMGRGVARLAELLPDVELVTFPGARHSIEDEIPEQVADAIRVFLAAQPS